MKICTNNAYESRIHSWFIVDFPVIEYLVVSITVINGVCDIILYHYSKERARNNLGILRPLP
jgi:hypothetical protein